MKRDGTDVPCEGTVWVVPDDGTVVRTRLRLRKFADTMTMSEMKDRRPAAAGQTDTSRRQRSGRRRPPRRRSPLLPRQRRASPRQPVAGSTTAQSSAPPPDPGPQSRRMDAMEDMFPTI